MALSHVKIKWTKPDTPWVCRVEYYRPKTTWKRYRGADTKCEKPNYTIYDPCYELSPLITGYVEIFGSSQDWQKYAGRETSGAGACNDQNQLYVMLQSVPPSMSVNTPLFYEMNQFRHYSGDDIRLSRGSHMWEWYADPALGIDFSAVIGMKSALNFYCRNNYSGPSSSMASITGMGFDILKTMYCELYSGICVYSGNIFNYGFKCEAENTYQIEIAAKDWLVPDNPHNCEGIGQKYAIHHSLRLKSPIQLILGEPNTWQGSWDPPLEGEYMLGVKNEAGEFFPICPIVDS